MDSLINAAARALATGDPLGALKLVALRDDAPALALRGIAMAQIGDFPRARALIRAAANAFGPKEAVARARCIVAEAEIALASRDLGWPAARLAAAGATLAAHGDPVNAAHARYLAIRRDVLLGRLDAAAQALAIEDAARLPPALRAVHELMLAGIAIRRVRTGAARDALARAADAARVARVPALLSEVQGAARALAAPAARVVTRDGLRPITLAEVEALFRSGALVVDACRSTIRRRSSVLALATRPVLFGLVHLLAHAWPRDVPRAELVSRLFRARAADESYRARLRVEAGRLRRALGELAEVDATARGYALLPPRGAEVIVLERPVDGEHGAILALLADGESWSSSALALALGSSQRTVQRSLDALAAARQVQGVGRGRARRWLTPALPGFATSLLLPTTLPGD